MALKSRSLSFFLIGEVQLSSLIYVYIYLLFEEVIYSLSTRFESYKKV